ncbi:thioesterase family protein [bacterium]|nr:thioesterase family protein [bacterium]MDG1435203.1 thioesterase family protein [Saprospiraceae bacterium]
MRELLKEFPSIIELPVQWGEMDAAKHVNNSVYIRWGESARIAYFDRMNLDNSFTEQIGPILGWQDCKYIFPVTYPDTISIGVKTVEIKYDRFFVECHMFSHKHQRLVAINKNSIIAYDYHNFKKVELPEEWIVKINVLEGKIS